MDSRTAVSVVALAMFLISLKEDMTFLVKLNSLAAICSAYILFWQLTSCSTELYIHGLPRVIPGFPGGWSFGVLPGMISYTVACHGWILPVVSTLQDRSSAAKNLTVSFALVVALLVVAGSASVLAFGTDHQIPQDFLTDFNEQRLFPFSTVVALTLEATIFTPLMLLLSKETLQEMIYGNSDSDIPGHVKFGLNLVIIGIACWVALCFPNVGDVMAWAGAICGFFLAFLFPMWFDLLENGFSAARCIVNSIVVLSGFTMLVLQVASAYA